MATVKKENAPSKKNEPKKKKEKVVKQIVFLWTYKDPEKKGAIQNGEIEAVSLNAAKVALRQRGFITQYITLKPQKTGSFGQSVKMSDIVGFLQQLSTLQNAGVSTMEGLQMLRMTSKKAEMKNMVQKMIRSLQTGEQLSDALAQFPKYFDHISTNLIRAGEQGGVLDTVLQNIADYKERDYTLKKKTKSALMYPAITVLVMIVVVIILMVKVIPVFAGLFKSFGSQLPFLTREVVDLSDWLQTHIPELIFGPIVIVASIIWLYKRYPKVRWFIDRITLRIPIIGSLLLKSATARFMHTLALLYQAGVPIQESMGTLATISGNSVIDAGIAEARESVLAGGRIAMGLKSTKLPDMAVRMLDIGESSGNVELMAKKAGDFYAKEVDEMVERMSTLLEPFIMIFLGVVIGTLVVAMYLPMLDMGKAILKGTGQG